MAKLKAGIIFPYNPVTGTITPSSASVSAKATAPGGKKVKVEVTISFTVDNAALKKNQDFDITEEEFKTKDHRGEVYLPFDGSTLTIKGAKNDELTIDPTSVTDPPIGILSFIVEGGKIGGAGI